MRTCNDLKLFSMFGVVVTQAYVIYCVLEVEETQTSISQWCILWGYQLYLTYLSPLDIKNLCLRPWDTRIGGQSSLHQNSEKCSEALRHQKLFLIFWMFQLKIRIQKFKILKIWQKMALTPLRQLWGTALMQAWLLDRPPLEILLISSLESRHVYVSIPRLYVCLYA